MINLTAPSNVKVVIKETTTKTMSHYFRKLSTNMILRNSAQKLKKASLTFDKVNELEK